MNPTVIKFWHLISEVNQEIWPKVFFSVSLLGAIEVLLL